MDPLAPLTSEAVDVFQQLNAKRDADIARSNSSHRGLFSTPNGGSGVIDRGFRPSGGGGTGINLAGSSGPLNLKFGSTRHLTIGNISRSASEASGTHHLLGNNSATPDGGLLVVDEGDEDAFERDLRPKEKPLNVTTRNDVVRSLQQPHEHVAFSPVRFEPVGNAGAGKGKGRSRSRSGSPRAFTNEYANAAPANRTGSGSSRSIRPSSPSASSRSLSRGNPNSPAPKVPMPYVSHAVPSAAGGQHNRSASFSQAQFMRWKGHPDSAIPVVMQEADISDQYENRIPEEQVPGVKPRMGTVGSPHPFGKYRQSRSGSRSRSIPMPELEGRESPYDAAMRRQESALRTDAPSPRDVSIIQGRADGFPRVTAVKRFIPDNRGPLHETCLILSSIRGQKPPEIPEHVYHAWDNYVGPGAFFVKYSRTGSPHERFFDIRILESDAQTREPYLVWSTHDKAVACKGRMHLAFLQGVRIGVEGDAAFEKHLEADGVSIRGPIMDAARSQLSRDLAMTIFFHTPHSHTVSVLCVNETIFQAWRLVLCFLSDVNRNQAQTVDVSAFRHINGGGESIGSQDVIRPNPTSPLSPGGANSTGGGGRHTTSQRALSEPADGPADDH